MARGVYPRTPEMNANNSALKKKFYRENPEFQKEIHGTSAARANHRIAQKRFNREHPNAALEYNNIAEELGLIQQYGSPLINRLRSVYWNLNSRCSDPHNLAYDNYGGRGIENLFISQLDFLNYIIDGLHIVIYEQIEDLEIDRINNDGNYEPGNIRFVTSRVNQNNRRNNKN